MQEKKSQQNEKYFAAANTYHGFKSYFAEIFAPEEYDRIYVIKGGPGTGKSSMMKKIGAHFSEMDCKVEEIYCSSDPHSLDGIICEYGERKIAVIDGTSPHETDAKIPGAIDEIINLGENWDTRWLSIKKDDILALNKEKSTSYKTAYSYLKIAGEASDFIMSVSASSYDFNRSKKVVKTVCRELTSNNEKISKTRLVSSFGKQGHYKLDTLKQISGKCIKISGDEFPIMILLNEISKQLSCDGISYTRFPCALDPSYLDAIYIPGADVAFMPGENGDINANEMINKSSGYDSERIKTASSIRDIALTEATRWFAIASDLHFRLEDIYSQAMSFDKNDALLAKKLKEMENILEV